MRLPTTSTRLLTRLPGRRPGPSRNGGTPRQRLTDRLGHRTRTLGLAGLLAVLTLILVVAYVRGYKNDVEATVAAVPVLVAARDIPDATAGPALHRFVERRMLPRRAIVPGAVADVARLDELVAAGPIYAGEQITLRRFRPLAAAGIRGRLNGTLRAFVLPGEPNQILGGIARPEDRVDVAATTAGSGAGGPISRVVLRDLLVLETRPGAVVLSVTDREAQQLLYVVKHGQWTLLLRPFGRAAQTPERLENLGTVFGEGLG